MFSAPTRASLAGSSATDAAKAAATEAETNKKALKSSNKSATAPKTEAADFTSELTFASESLPDSTMRPLFPIPEFKHESEVEDKEMEEVEEIDEFDLEAELEKAYQEGLDALLILDWI